MTYLDQIKSILKERESLLDKNRYLIIFNPSVGGG